MCYGDMAHGNDGYYEDWARRQIEELPFKDIPKSNSFENAFGLVMGDSSMPDESDAHYDRWLFTKAYTAARTALIVEIVEKLEGEKRNTWGTDELKVFNKGIIKAIEVVKEIGRSNKE